MTTGVDAITERLLKLNRGTVAVLVGLLAGGLAGLVGLGIVVIGPVYTAAILIGLLAGLYILTDLSAALYAVIAVIGLIPYGTLPFKIVITPSLLDLVLGAFLMVYVFQWMTGRRRLFRFTPVHGVVLVFALILLFSFLMGLRHAPLTNNILKQFVEMIMAIALAFVLPDVLRDERALERLMRVVVLLGAATALIGIVLYVLPDTLTEQILVRLAPFGYPNGGVVRYVEDNPNLAERAIGVWIDPNSYGGVLAVLGALIAPHLFSQRGLGWPRWITAGAVGLIGLALLLTFSRGSMLALGAALVFIAVIRYRKLLWLMVAAGLLILVLPVTQAYVMRMIEGFQFADRASQMRVGEITDALRLIGRYPLFGVGFSGTPTRDIYLGVANLYLTMAGNMGLLGLGTYFVMLATLFGYGLMAWRRQGRANHFEPYWLGAYAGIVTVLAAGVFDHYFFKLEFQASAALFWLVFGLAMTVSRLWLLADSGPSIPAAAE
ncbi:MAG: O-antigen ligase family protein [Anaerolineae bacterium]|nr:O-antigen ligase family protein [Anaerolineae bacterium]